MNKILTSLTVITLAMLASIGGTAAYFSDTETSIGNSFSAGTLDLNVDGGNTNVVKFSVTNMRPGNQPRSSYTLANVGTLNGYLDIENVTFSSDENGCGEPETEAGDMTCGNPGATEGELANVVNLRLFADTNGDGSISTGENVFYNGKVKDLPTNFELNQALNAGTDTKVVALLDWWSTADDNKAQNDSMTIDMTFELAQTTAQ